MSLNSTELSVILDELDLTGGFVREIVQSGFDTISFNVYKEGNSKNILVCLAPGTCRMHETFRAVPKNEKPLRFMQFLRAHIKGSRIAFCEQIGNERVVKIELTNGEQKLLMFIRLWSGAANIVVTDIDLNILDVFFRRPKRSEITGGKFILPEIRNNKDKILDDKFTRVRTFDEVQTKHGTFNEKVDAWYATHAQTLSIEALRQQTKKHFDVQHAKMTGALNRLEKKRSEFMNAEKWKHYGDLVMTFGHLINDDSNMLECMDYETDSTVLIPVDSKKTAHDNASVYYEKYKKSVSGLVELEKDISRLKREILDLEAAYDAIEKEDNPLRIEQMLRKQTKPKQQIEKTIPGLQYEINGWTVLVGRDASENDELLRHHAKGLDLWLHSRDTAGGFVFIKNRPGKTVPLDILLDAGNLAVYFSKARKAGTADLYCTNVKYLRRAKNAPKGTVLPTHEKNITIKLDKERLDRLKVESQLVE